MTRPKIHGATLSPFVRKVRFALAEKGIEYDIEPVIPFGVSDDFKKISPLGKIPVYQEGDFTVPDSSVIIDYLEHVKPSPALYPSDPQERARALFLEEYADTRLVEVIGTVFFQRFVQRNLFQKDPDEALVREAIEEKLPPTADFLEASIGDAEYAVGGRFGVADIAISSPFVNFALGGEQLDAGRWPKLAAYVARVHGRPALKSIVESDLGG
jgi:glutathione S-transferase